MLSLRPSGTFDTFQTDLSAQEHPTSHSDHHFNTWLKSKGLDTADAGSLSEKDYSYARVHFQLDTILQQLCNLETGVK